MELSKRTVPHALGTEKFASDATDTLTLAAIWDTAIVNAPPAAPITRFTSVFNVPPPPIKQQGQHIFIFCGLQSGSDSDLKINICAVLRWGVDGLNWSVASSLVASFASGNAGTASAPTLVNSGDRLQCTLQLDSQSDDVLIYSVRFEGIESSLTTIELPLQQKLVQVGFALEATNINDRSNFPDAEVTSFESVSVEISGCKGTPNWTLRNQPNIWGAHIALEPGGSSDDGIAIRYGK